MSHHGPSWAVGILLLREFGGCAAAAACRGDRRDDGGGDEHAERGEDGGLVRFASFGRMGEAGQRGQRHDRHRTAQQSHGGREGRRAREAAGRGFHEIYVKADLATCESRDPKGLYAKARSGEIKDFTGISAPYEAPETPELVIDTASTPLEECLAELVGYVEAKFRV